MTTKPIVVGTDGSAQAVRAVEWAAREAVLRSAPLRIVSAAEMLPRMSAPPQGAGIRHRRQLTSSASVTRRWPAAASAAAATAPDLLIDTDPLDGPPGPGGHRQRLRRAAARRRIARRRRVRRHDPRVGEPLRRRARLVPGRGGTGREPRPRTAWLPSAYGARRTAAPRSRSPSRRPSLRKAALLAVHAWQFPDSHAAERAAAELDDLLNDWRGKYPDVNASRDVVHGHPGRVLADLSARADLVVLGRHNASDRLVPGPARVIHAVVSHAHGPVVIVPPQRFPINRRSS